MDEQNYYEIDITIRHNGEVIKDTEGSVSENAVNAFGSTHAGNLLEEIGIALLKHTIAELD